MRVQTRLRFGFRFDIWNGVLVRRWIVVGFAVVENDWQRSAAGFEVLTVRLGEEDGV